jgi:hypothetical protein
MLHDRNFDWLKYEEYVFNKQLKALLRPILPDIRNSASPACPSDKSLSRWCIWSIGGMILPREFEVLGEEPPQLPLYPPNISHEVEPLQLPLYSPQI